MIVKRSVIVKGFNWTALASAILSIYDFTLTTVFVFECNVNVSVCVYTVNTKPISDFCRLLLVVSLPCLN